MPKAIIVGATSGIGKEVALQLLAKGWELGICLLYTSDAADE